VRRGLDANQGGALDATPTVASNDHGSPFEETDYGAAIGQASRRVDPTRWRIEITGGQRRARWNVESVGEM
jgi:hypothetical protein